MHIFLCRNFLVEFKLNNNTYIVFLLTFCSLCSFRDALTIKNIDDALINNLEKYINDEVLEKIIKFEKKTKLILDRKMFFGDHADEPNSFKITAGEREQLKEVALFAKEKFEKRGSSYFSKKKNHNLFNTIDCGNLGRLFVDEINYGSRMDKKSKTVLHASAVDILKSGKVESTILAQFTEEMVDITSTNNILRGTVECVLCPTAKNGKKEKKKFIINSKHDENHSWIFSNFIKHLRNNHKLDIPKKIGKSSTDKSIEKTSHVFDKEAVADNCSIVFNDGMCDDAQNELQENEPKVVISDQLLIDCDNRFKNTQSKIYDLISTQAMEMLENSEAMDELSQLLEFECCAKRCSSKIVEVAKDGNCIFSAMVHQLFKPKIDSENHKDLTKQIRVDIISYIRKNPTLFKSELESRIFAKKKPQMIQSMDTEMEMILGDLSRDGIWGGDESLKAVKYLYKRNILVITELGDFYFACPFEETFEAMLILAFRVKGNIDRNEKKIPNIDRDHYDSVIHIEPSDIFSISEELSKRLKKGYSLKQNVFDLTE